MDHRGTELEGGGIAESHQPGTMAFATIVACASLSLITTAIWVALLWPAAAP